MDVIKIPKNYKWIILGILNSLSSVCLVLVSLFSKYLLDNINDKDKLKTYLLLMILCIIIGIAFKFIENILYARFVVKRELALKRILIEKRLSCYFLDNIHSSTLMQNYNMDIKNIVEGELNIAPRIIFDAVRFIASFVLILIIDYKVMLMLIAIGIVMLIGALIYYKNIKALNKNYLAKNDNINKFTNEILNNDDLIYAYNSSNSFLEFYSKREQELKVALNKKYNFQILASNLTSLGSNILYALFIAYGALAINKGALGIGGLLAIIELIGHIEGPVLNISSYINKYSEALVSKERINSIKIKEYQKLINIDNFNYIEAKNLGFAYGEDLIIRDLSFKINKGDIIEIKGESGVGKSTLFLLLQGYLNPTSGYLKAYDKNLKEINSLRSLFAYVPQRQMLFSGTVYDNFKLLATNDEALMKEALEFAALDKEISLDSKLSEAGGGISIGQLQRLMIAIAYATKRPIFLLDEFSSALDDNNAQIIKSNLIKANKTIIYISHKNENLNNTKTINL